MIERRPVRLHLQRIRFPKILLLSAPSGNAEIRLAGILLAIGAALCYSFYLVIVNRSKRIKKVSEQTLTLYSLITGAVLFAVILAFQGEYILEGLDTPADWGILMGLAIVPTMIATLTLADAEACARIALKIL